MKTVFLALLALAPGLAAAAPRDPLDGLSLNALATTRERPLFAPTRRPPPPVPVETPAPAPVARELPPPPPAPVPWELAGAVIGRGEAIALLRNKTSNAFLRLRVGETSEGWRLARVERREAVLEREGRSETLALAVAPAGAGVELADGADPGAAPAPEIDVRAAPRRLRPER